jgi:hypothetical protein
VVERPQTPTLGNVTYVKSQLTSLLNDCVVALGTNTDGLGVDERDALARLLVEKQTTLKYILDTLQRSPAPANEKTRPSTAPVISERLRPHSAAMMTRVMPRPSAKRPVSAKEQQKPKVVVADMVTMALRKKYDSASLYNDGIYRDLQQQKSTIPKTADFRL